MPDGIRREPEERRGLLFIGHRFPYPPDRGEKIRSYNLLRHLSQRWEIYCGCLSDQPGEERHASALAPYCREFVSFPISKRRQKLSALLRARPGRPLMLDYYRHDGLQAWVRETLAKRRIDLVYIFSAAMAPYVPLDDTRPSVLDMQDVDSEKWREYGTSKGLLLRPLWSREARTLLSYERQAAARSHSTLLVSERECRRFAELAPEISGRLLTIGMGVDLENFSPSQPLAAPYDTTSPSIVFTGNMDYWPNADAVQWFATTILPLVRCRHPKACFYAVGANPGPELKALEQQPGVVVTGRVPDVRPYVAHANVSVAPLRLARGIQNKVIEAMAMARPVVATPEAAGGVRAEPGRELLVASKEADFAARVSEVIEGRWQELGAAARQAVEARYAWPEILARLDDCLAAALASKETRSKQCAATSDDPMSQDVARSKGFI